MTSTIKVNTIQDSGGNTILSSDGAGTITQTASIGSFTSTGIDDNASSTAITIDSSQNVGIGTSSPLYQFDVGNGSGNKSINIFSGSTSIGALYFTDSTSGTGSYIGRVAYDHSSDAMLFTTNTSERMRIDSSGQVGIGTSSPQYRIESVGTNAGGEVTGLAIRNNATTAGGSASIYFVNSTDPTSAANRNKISSIRGSSGHDLVFYTNNGTLTEAVRIDSSGNVGIGTTTPDLGFGGTYLEVANLTTTPAITIRSDRAGGGNLQFADQDDVNVGYISYQHNNDRMVFRAGDNQQVYIDGAGCMMLGTTTTGSAGNGDLVVNGNIFLGGTGTANALDDYEEGTFTPTWIGTTSNPTIPSYGIRTGIYTKIGDIVYVQIQLQCIGTPSGGGGELQISGLPFLGKTGQESGNAHFSFCNNLTAQTDQSDWSGNIDGNNDKIRVSYHEFNGTTAMGRVPVSALYNLNPRMSVSFMYKTN